MGTFLFALQRKSREKADKKGDKMGTFFSCVGHRMIETSNTNVNILSRRKNLRTLIIEHSKCHDWCPLFYWETRLSLINGVSGYGTKVLRNVAIREGHSEPG